MTRQTAISCIASDCEHRSVLKVRVGNPQLVEDLVETLRGADCDATVIDPHTCGVAFLDGTDPRLARMEIRFFLRAWQCKHGATDVLLLA
jgi:hypothetical protein